MKNVLRIVLVTCIGIVSISTIAKAEKAYLYLDSIPGESIDDQHADWIDIESWQWQVSSPMTFDSLAVGGTSGKATPRPLIVLKHIDKSSPLLAIAVFDGQHLPNVILDVVSDTGNSVLKITLEEAVVSNVSLGDNLMESVALIFRKICYHYYPFNPDGTPQTPIDKCWDIGTNTEG